MKPLLQSETFVRIAAPLAVGIVLIGMWEVGCRLASIPVYLFPKLKAELRGNHFPGNEDVMVAVDGWFHDQQKEFFLNVVNDDQIIRSYIFNQSLNISFVKKN